jgi:hypothetical protein
MYPCKRPTDVQHIHLQPPLAIRMQTGKTETSESCNSLPVVLETVVRYCRRKVELNLVRKASDGADVYILHSLDGPQDKHIDGAIVICYAAT